MALQSLWIHGHSATIELNERGRGGAEDVNGIQWTAAFGLRTGWGVQYRCQNNSNYGFSFPVPTLALANGRRVRLRRATVLFTADRGVTLSLLEVWDDQNPVFARQGLAIGGTNRSQVDERNSFALPDIEVFSGLNIFVRFDFADPAVLTLHAAGLEVET